MAVPLPRLYAVAEDVAEMRQRYVEMHEVIAWWPLLWIWRVLIALVGIIVIALVGVVGLYLVRFFRWNNIRTLVTGDLPRIEEFEVFKGFVRVRTEADRAQALQLGALAARLKKMEAKHDALARRVRD